MTTAVLPEIAMVVYGAIGAAAAFTDYREGKIYNWLTLPALLLGLGLAALGGWSPFAQALLGLGVAAILFLPLYFTGVLGGGDVKLVMALGTVLGPENTFELVLASLAIAAAGAVGLLIRHQRVRAFAKEIWFFVRSVFVRDLEIHWPKLRRDIKAPFGIAIFLGFLCVIMR